MAIWKVSYVVKSSELPGGIINLDHTPEPGEILQIGDTHLEILEAFELIPARGDFHYIHATCKVIEQTE